MLWRIEIKEKDGFFDALGKGVQKDIEELGFRGKVIDVRTVSVYLIEGTLREDEVRSICAELLTDPIAQEYSYQRPVCDERAYKVVEVAYNPGVMDPVEESARKAVKDLGINGITAIKTARKYLIKGRLSYADIHAIAEGVLYNKIIQHLVTGRSTIPPEPSPYTFKLRHVKLLGATDAQLKEISKTGQLFLNLDEMRAIQKYFARAKRNPTDCELETIAQTWSEHCKHKTFRGRIAYEGKIIDNLLKSTVMKVTKELAKPWCVSVFKDNSGIIRFDKNHNICFKVETHNHPSALEPYGGAGTGIGGVIRDPLGTGMGARPIINTDIFCFGPIDYPHQKLPKNALHPRRVMKGVVAGVRDYGNRMGIPTSNGAILFDENFVGNPLVFCGNVGIMPKDASDKKVHKNDLIVVVGGRTGRDGIHGATFSSGELTHETKETLGSAVQIGNPIQEKKVTDTILKARDLGLYHAITDCGAGGLSSAVGEMGETLGALVWLDKVPLKYTGLRYDEIWISEAQERMVLAVDPKKMDALRALFASENVEATVIGEFTGTGKLTLLYNGACVCDMAMDFLHDGLPEVVRTAVWQRPIYAEPAAPKHTNFTADLLALLGTGNIASKEWVIRQYDHEVQGGSVLKPLQGIACDGPGDACITRPLLDSRKGIILSCGICPDFGKIDPYWMAASAIDEALRQVVAVGGDITKAAILDNFCWGNTDKPDRLGGLVRASYGCYDIAKAYGVPFISGKDSLNNEYSTGTTTIAIPPTLLISCIAVMNDVTRAVTMDAKEPGNAVYLVGLTHNELGGSQYFKMKGSIGNSVPKVRPAEGKKIFAALGRAMKAGTVRACHDCSEGGAAVALAEMAFAGGRGMRLAFDRRTMPKGQETLDAAALLFAESNSRFIVEVRDESRFVKAMRGIPVWKLGTTTSAARFTITDGAGKTTVATDIRRLKAAWQKPFREL